MDDNGKQCKGWLLLNWAGADWLHIQPLLDAGRLPHLETLIRRGSMGKLQSTPPLIGPVLSSSLVTGRYSDEHGITGFATRSNEAPGCRPMSSLDLQAPPLWQQVNDTGLSAVAMGWPMSQPATAFDGLVISDAFADADGPDSKHWPLRPGSVSRPALAELFGDLRLHPGDITPEQLQPFVPRAAQVDQVNDERLSILATYMARAATIHAAGTWVAEYGQWDLLAIHFDLVEQLSGHFGQYRPPQLSHIADQDFALYRDVVDAGYLFMDMLLGRYLSLLGPDQGIMLVSDHGFPTRPQKFSHHSGIEKINPMFREVGMVLCQGPGIREDQLIFGAHQLDIVPTLLQLLGLPIDESLPGGVLEQLFVRPPTIHRRETDLNWRPNPAAEPRHAPGVTRLIELVAEGYLSHLCDDPDLNRQTIAIEQYLVLAKAKLARQAHREALDVLEILLTVAPDHREARLLVARCWCLLDELPRCRNALEDLVDSGMRGPWVDYLYGQLHSKQGNTELALNHLLRAADTGADGWQLLEKIGRTHLRLGQWPEAEVAFARALAIHPESPRSHNGLGIALAARQQHRTAIKHQLRSIGLHYCQADSHYQLGLSLNATGQYRRAAEAFNTALAIEPALAEAQQALAVTQRQLTDTIEETIQQP